MTTERPGPAEVHLISGARTSHSDDLDRRMKRYLISMGIRTACVVLAVVVHGPFRWVFFVGAVILPYIAVVMANAVGGRRDRPAAVTPVPRTAVTGTARPYGADRPHGADRPAEQGEYVADVSGAAVSTERVIPGSHERTA